MTTIENDHLKLNMTKIKFAVMGTPIKHSLSPVIHQHFAKEFGLLIDYERIDPQKNGFANSVEKFFQHKGHGLNVTAPYKHSAWKLANKRSKVANIAQSVNTLWYREDGTIVGDNTDGIGFIRDLTVNLKFFLKKKKILVLGAGGAVRGILQALIDQEVQSITLINRTSAKAQHLVEQFGQCLSLGFHDQKVTEPYDLVINGTTPNAQGCLALIPEGSINRQTVFYDLSYGSVVNNSLKLIRGSHDCLIFNGLGMLVEQAAESFYIWNKKKPTTASLIHELHSFLFNQP